MNKILILLVALILTGAGCNKLSSNKNPASNSPAIQTETDSISNYNDYYYSIISHSDYHIPKNNRTNYKTGYGLYYFNKNDKTNIKFLLDLTGANGEKTSFTSGVGLYKDFVTFTSDNRYDLQEGQGKEFDMQDKVWIYNLTTKTLQSKSVERGNFSPNWHYYNYAELGPKISERVNKKIIPYLESTKLMILDIETGLAKPAVTLPNDKSFISVAECQWGVPSVPLFDWVDDSTIKYQEYYQKDTVDCPAGAPPNKAIFRKPVSGLDIYKTINITKTFNP